MPLPMPNLDDRTFQDLVDEAKRRIPRYCPNWTDHNVSDPGITLIELFAWLTEQYLFRLNQVPDKNFIAFLNLIGVHLEPARPARGAVTFTLSAAPVPGRRAIIPVWTEVATERTETEEAIGFTTDREAEVLPPEPLWLLTSSDGQDFADQSAALKDDAPFDAWGASLSSSEAFYIGFGNDLSAHTLVLQFQCEKVGIGIDPGKPPWRWEAWRGAEFGWQTVEVVADATAGLNKGGEVKLHLPVHCQPHRLRLRDANTWVRCSPVDQLPPGEAPYAHSPRIRRLSAYTIGISVPVTHALPVGPEILGISSGQPGQSFRLQQPGVLALSGPEEVIEVSTEAGGWEIWQVVPDFADSGAADKHCTCDPVTGEIAFGPAVPRRDGTKPQRGDIPPLGRTIRIRRYRVGGGVRGNVAAGRVKVLKSTLPYVASIVNREPITGGLEPESMDHAKLRGPAMLRTRHRAVTTEDYEYLAREVEGVGRVRCLQPNPDDPEAPPPGTVLLLVIPQMPPLEGAELDRHIELHEAIAQQNRRRATEATLLAQLALSETTEARLRDYLDDRRLLTTRIQIRQPHYVWVTVQTRIKVHPKAEPGRVVYDVKMALYKFLHPQFGGSEKTGWSFGRPLTIDKVYALIQEVPGVEYATELNLFPITIGDPTGQSLGQSAQIISVPANGVIVSYYHNVYAAR